MGKETTYKCDLCGEFAHKDDLLTVKVGGRSLRDEDYETIDVDKTCKSRPISDLAAVFIERREGVVE